MLVNEKQIHQLLQIVMKINENDKYESSFKYAGHVHEISIVIYKAGTSERIYDEYFYLDISPSDCKSIETIIHELTDKFITPKVPESNG